MYRIILAFLLLLGVTGGGRAQINYFKPATVTLTDGTVRTGFVNYDRDNILTERVRFREGADAAEEVYLAAEVREVTLTEAGRTFRQVEHQFLDLTNGPGQEVRVLRLGELLFEGDLALYRVPRDERESHGERLAGHVYYLDHGTRVSRLDQVKVWDEQLGRGGVANRYRGVLRVILADWPEAERRTRNLDFQDQDLVRLLRDYTAYVNPEADPFTAVQKSSTSRLRHGVRGTYYSGGVIQEDIKFRRGFGVGYGIAYLNPRFSNAITFFLSGELGFFSFDDVATTTATVSRTSRTRLLQLGLNYYFSRTSRVQPFAQFNLGPLWETIEVEVRQRGVDLTTGEPVVSTRKRTASGYVGAPVSFGAGVEVGHFSLGAYLGTLGLHATANYYINQ